MWLAMKSSSYGTFCRYLFEIRRVTHLYGLFVSSGDVKQTFTNDKITMGLYSVKGLQMEIS